MFSVNLYIFLSDSSCFVFHYPRVMLIKNYFGKPVTALGQLLLKGSLQFKYPLQSWNSTGFPSSSEASAGLVVTAIKIIEYCFKVSCNPICSILNTFSQ